MSGIRLPFEGCGKTWQEAELRTVLRDSAGSFLRSPPHALHATDVQAHINIHVPAAIPLDPTPVLHIDVEPRRCACTCT